MLIVPLISYFLSGKNGPSDLEVLENDASQDLDVVEERG